MTMPWLDRTVYHGVGHVMGWLGKRAWRRGDTVFFDAMRAALLAGHVPGRIKPRRVEN